ncbi:hypothetical protein EDC65_0581 [Stella humosa]|uniref:Copper(I)-binding protein n=1 Tax=Stella humosa TaxID=94 RepID=A0A3N1M6D7_9PROT|nr:copper chaperone PCu(A)C [Stella humosa]ROQ01402.1 hypothetical protein EDC65_0581 [Stella humosa]BBK31778.1 hypothetical protein STHU_24120 [Stella humosa]
MKGRSTILALAMLAGAGMPALAQAPATAATAIEIVQPWARPTAGGAKTGAAYVTLRNPAAAADRLLSAAAPVADAVELHTVVKDGDVMRMRPVAGIDIAAGSTTRLEPGGFHIMLIGLKAPLKAGDRFPLELVFEKAGRLTADVAVGQPGGHGGPMKH